MLIFAHPIPISQFKRLLLPKLQNLKNLILNIEIEMNNFLIILLASVGAAALAAVITWLAMRSRLSVTKTILEERTSEGIQFQETIRERDEALRGLADERQRLTTRVEVLTSQLEEQKRQAAQAQEALEKRFDETMAKVSAQMQATTNDMLRQRQKEFAESSGTSLGQIVNPLRETIDKMQQTMTQARTQQSEDTGAMKAIIEKMMQQNEKVRESTQELTNAFRYSNTVQGSWGEAVLDELLESQGLTRGVHYDVQSSLRDASGVTVTNEDDSRMRPDVILHLDQRREVIIDSKVSLAAFMDYVNATDEGERQRYLKAHVASLQEQVNRLAKKDYSSYIQPPKVKMDYVIMFVPNTGALWTALGAQPDLWRRAMERGVYIADEQTLFAALRIIRLTWTQIAQAQNHERVFALATEMMDRVGQFAKNFQALGADLEKARKAYDLAGSKLQPSGQSILQTCYKLQKLGAKQSTKNPLPPLTDVDDIPALDVPSEQQEE